MSIIHKQVFENQTVSTNVKAAPVNPKFNLDYAASIKWTTPTFVSDETTPKVAITAPTSTTSIEAGAAVAIAATATDTDGTISKVEFSVNGTLISTDETSPYTATWTPTTKGAYTITAKATDNTNKTGTATVTANVTVPQSPYGGTPLAIPGKIEFEHFDEGGADAAYSDSSPGSETDVAFRADEDVDIENCTDVGTGYNLGWTVAGEWLEYTVNVGAAGKYKLDLRVACSGTGRTITLKMGETTIANNVTIPSTTGWQIWQTVTVPEVTLAAGKQVLRVTIGATDYVNLNYMTFTSLDVKDDCPNDPNKTAPGTCGCGVPDVDTDKDGIMDCLDGCPADAKKTAPGLCGCGVVEGTCSTISIPLKAGWNLVGYPYEKSVTIEIAFSSIFDKLEIVKDQNGFYTKSGSQFLNSLKTVSWAKGYLIKVSAPCELKWTDK
ncbi:MAG: carbohydrate-binding protein [Bacteroidales bacterium]|nr:carbohydrate-binding protein [Bacteroidales bacterium]